MTRAGPQPIQASVSGGASSPAVFLSPLGGRVRVGVLGLVVLAPALSSAQVQLSAVENNGGTVLGRVCRDVDGDGGCSSGEPAVAGARLLLDSGQVAVTDSEGRFHFLEVSGRMLLPGRSAYGGHVVAVEGPWGEDRVRRYFELPAGGAVQVDLALPLVAERPPPRLEPAELPRSFAPVSDQGKLLWALTGRVPPGSLVTVDGRETRVTGEGDYAAPVWLRPHRNLFQITVIEPTGQLTLYFQEIHFVARREGGDAVVPFPPERLATLALPPSGTPVQGLDLFVQGQVAPGVSLRIAGEEVVPASGGGFTWRVPLRTGETALLIEATRAADTVSVSPRLRFQRRAGAVAGIADVELSLPGKNRFFTGRAAIAARGTYDDLEGEMGVDLDDRDRPVNTLLHPRDPMAVEHSLLPEYRFPTAGDQAAAGDLNAPRGRLYARLTAPGARLDLGALRPGFTGHELGRYDRSLYGAQLAGNGVLGPLRLTGKVFGSSRRADPGQVAPPRPAHEELVATGGSLFYLRHGEVVVGSDALRVEWRDGLTGLVVKQQALVRTVDYEIDYLAGRLLLASPLSSVAGPPAIVTGDPFSAPQAVLLADYSFASSAGGGDDAGGGLGSLEVGPLRFEAAVAKEDRPGETYSLGAAAAELSWGKPLRLRAEVARSHGAAFSWAGESHYARSIDGGITFAAAPVLAGGDRNAFHLEARGEAAGTQYHGWWRERPRGYSDSSHFVTVDAWERGASATFTRSGTELSAAYGERRGADPRDPVGVAPLDTREVRGQAGHWFGDLRLLAEIVDAQTDTPRETGSQWSGGLRTDLRVAPWLTLDASHHQSLACEGHGPAAIDATFSAVGATITGQGSSLTARGGWGPALGPRVVLAGERRTSDEAVYGTLSVDPDGPSVFRESVSTLGVRRSEGNAEVFSESQFARDPFGMRASRVNGMAVELITGLRLSASAESGSRLRLDDTLVDRRAAGATVSWVRDRLRLSARGEIRQEGADQQSVAGGGAEWRATGRLTFSSRGTWSNGTWAGQPVYFASVSLGSGWRSDTWSMLAKLAGIAEQRPGRVRRDTGLASLAFTMDLSQRLALGLGANLGLTRLVGAKEDLASGSVRVRYRIKGPLDVAAEYARRQSLSGRDPEWLDAVRAEAGWALGQGRIALGYNLFGFSGSGVDPADEDQSRVYLRAELVY